VDRPIWKKSSLSPPLNLCFPGVFLSKTNSFHRETMLKLVTYMFFFGEINVFLKVS
jgi:hypothetical protein